ncbi:tRNA pseudouridine(13) synthase TruD [Thiocystis violacea]|uniref:tRNA pseudouridine(13) synthase TruD n=1 Tax=Thiocystis violacea TaxID=13725 RepID=UPI001908E71B|nr:tRNA pseudouridine(13) synthase TruD [Thiocystis violacea]MBK1719383.1 tRNA pseudouridine(13) synthase TruD [Thiocystis violacea]
MSEPPLPSWTSSPDLPRAHGAPLGEGRLRVEPEDFRVTERLGFNPDGEGDHLLLWVRKTSANTEWVARRLAAVAGVPVSTVGYAGLKDRHAITEQWFSIPKPREGLPDWTPLGDQGIEVLETHPHRRKLKRGALAGNRFRIQARDCPVGVEDLETRLAAIRARGVPNYFGEQRFGHADGNLRQAHALLTGAARRVVRHQRGLWLSAARSQIFNELLAERVRRDDWDRPQPGEALQLAGSHSFFVANTIDDTLVARCGQRDLHPTGPLWGAGDPPTGPGVRALEVSIAQGFAPWLERLAGLGLEQERRALRLPVDDLVGELDGTGLRLEFSLPSGAYATAVLREIITWPLGDAVSIGD